MMFSTRRVICLLVIYVCLGLCLSQCNGETKGYEAAPRCATHECPSYTVVASQKEFEIRNYSDARWVFTQPISSTSYSKAATKSFLTLFKYFNGENKEQMKIKMTSPVLIGVENSNYTVFFYLPKNYQVYAPQPLKYGEVSLTNLPHSKFAAVRRFEGFIYDSLISFEVDALKKSLQSTPYQRAAAVGQFMVAAYNYSPFNFLNRDRVNEIIIWFD